MNYLAHLVLSPQDPLCAAANVVGDSLKGRLENYADLRVRRGAWLHRQIDQFTDNAEEVRALRSHISAPRRRLAGILSDLYFDHLLIRSWSGEALDTWLPQRESELSQAASMLPPLAAQRLQGILRYRLFLGCATHENMANVLQQIARRRPLLALLAGAEEEFTQLAPAAAAAFTVFYPRLRAYCSELMSSQPIG
jgi:acyl carrier protein phosphodiesterase